MGAKPTCCSEEEETVSTLKSEKAFELDAHSEVQEVTMQEEETTLKKDGHESEKKEEAKPQLLADDAPHFEEARQNQAEQEAREKEEAETRERNDKVIEWMKEHGYRDINEKKKKSLFGGSVYPILQAVEACDVNIVKGLLEMKADHTVKNAMGNTPVKIAQSKNYGSVVILLQAAAHPPPKGR